jgi:MFS family permease
MDGVNARRAWVVFGVGALAYLVAVLQRTSFGIAGVDATERFHAQAAVLSLVAVVQVATYAGLQVPVGVLIDRLGPKTLIVAGGVLMVAGQVAVAFAPSIGVAIAGRVLVGAGDAATFTSVQRSIVLWFSGRRAPLMSQLLGTVGQLGQVLSSIPFALLLHGAGWTPAFGVAAAAGAAATLSVLVLFSERPAGVPAPERGPAREALHHLLDALRRPGTRLGFWTHWVGGGSVNMFSLLWGVPFLSIGLGLGQQAAAGLLILVSVTGFVGGPVLGLLTARFPYRRSTVVLAIVAFSGVCWTAVLAWPGIPPLWLVVVLIVAFSLGGPGSLIGFDFARTFNPARNLGSANGIVNTGGFVAGFVTMFLVGVLLDLIDAAHGGTGAPDRLYAFDAFRIAMLAQYVVIGVGVVFVLRTRRHTRRRLEAEEGITVAPLWVALVRRWRRRRAS